MSSTAYWKNEAEKVADTGEVTDTDEVTDTSEVTDTKEATDTSELFFQANKDDSFNKDDIVNWIIEDCDLPFGQKVVKLQNVGSGKYRVLYWDSGNYKFAEVKENCLGKFPVKSHKNLKKNLISEIEHLLVRNKGDLGNEKYSTFDNLYSSIESAVNKIESKTDNDMYQLMTEFDARLFDSNKKEVARIDYFYELAEGVYNPNSAYSQILIVPLSTSFFYSTTKLKKIFSKSVFSQINYHTGDSGQIEKDENVIKDIKKGCSDLCALLEKDKLTHLPEYAWLKKNVIDNKDFNYKFLVFISDKTWDKGRYSRYAEGVAILSTLAWLSFSPLYDVILHESNYEEPNYWGRIFPQGDMHNTDTQSKDIWKQTTKLSSIEDLRPSSYNTDRLFQNSRNLELVNIGFFLNNIGVI